jgi:hypothetical protein
MESSLNVEDHGDWLSFGMVHAGGVIPVKISRAAMEDHFDAGQGPDSLKKAYALDAESDSRACGRPDRDGCCLHLGPAAGARHSTLLGHKGLAALERDCIHSAPTVCY